MTDLAEGTTCRRLLPYALHETRERMGVRCGRPAVDLGPDGEPRCAVHRGVDRRTETNRQRRARNRIRTPRRR